VALLVVVYQRPHRYRRNAPRRPRPPVASALRASTGSRSARECRCWSAKQPQPRGGPGRRGTRCSARPAPPSWIPKVDHRSQHPSSSIPEGWALMPTTAINEKQILLVDRPDRQDCPASLTPRGGLGLGPALWARPSSGSAPHGAAGINATSSRPSCRRRRAAFPSVLTAPEDRAHGGQDLIPRRRNASEVLQRYRPASSRPGSKYTPPPDIRSTPPSEDDVTRRGDAPARDARTPDMRRRRRSRPRS
jgi:hypothetical protein